MRFKIEANYNFETDVKVLVVSLFTRSDEDFLNGCEDGIYGCDSLFPEINKIINFTELLNTIQNHVNSCLDAYSKDMEDVIRKIIKENQPKVDEFMSICMDKGN